MPSIVVDASVLVGALLKAQSTPEQALLLARANGPICLSDAVEQEILTVFARPKFRKYITDERRERILDLIVTGAQRIIPTITVIDCRDPQDNKYLELALAAQATTIVSSDDDLICLHPWRGIEIVTPAEYVRRFATSTRSTEPET